MTIRSLVLKEIGYRKVNFGLGVLSVTVAVGCLVAELTLLRMHDLRTQEIIARKQAETEAEMAEMQDEYRKMALKMGFNIQILPREQKLGDFYDQDFATAYMPESYVQKLAASRIMTVRHLLPVLQVKQTWPEKRRKVIVVGARAEVPVSHRDPKKPIIDPVRPGTMVLGYELHNSLGIQVGDTVSFMGKTFAVTRCHEERGSKDDISLWINLAEAQELLGKEGKINGILALSCHCEGQRLARIREDVAAILPDTQVIEFASQAIMRAEARSEARRRAEQAIEAERAYRRELRQEREESAAVLVPLVALGAFVWIGFLALANVRERTGEIGILRALGLRGGSILLLFLMRAVLVGFAGAVLGYGGGLVVGGSMGAGSLQTEAAAELFSPALLALVLAASPVLSAFASWLPAVLAAQQDPAVVLREE